MENIDETKGEKFWVYLSEYHGYSENRGVIECPKCYEQIWCNFPDSGDEIKCPFCECNIVFTD